MEFVVGQQHVIWNDSCLQLFGCLALKTSITQRGIDVSAQACVIEALFNAQLVQNGIIFAFLNESTMFSLVVRQQHVIRNDFSLLFFGCLALKAATTQRGIDASTYAWMIEALFNAQLVHNGINFALLDKSILFNFVVGQRHGVIHVQAVYLSLSNATAYTRYKSETLR